MNRSTIIATCLHNSRMVDSLEFGEAAVLDVFEKRSFPKDHFDAWNTQVDERTANQIISNVGRAMTINVEKFIDDLRRY